MRSPTAPAPTPIALARSHSRRSLAIAHTRGARSPSRARWHLPATSKRLVRSVKHNFARLSIREWHSPVPGDRLVLRLRHRSMQQRVLEQSLLNEGPSTSRRTSTLLNKLLFHIFSLSPLLINITFFFLCSALANLISVEIFFLLIILFLFRGCARGLGGHGFAPMENRGDEFFAQSSAR